MPEKRYGGHTIHMSITLTIHGLGSMIDFFCSSPAGAVPVSSDLPVSAVTPITTIGTHTCAQSDSGWRLKWKNKRRSATV